MLQYIPIMDRGGFICKYNTTLLFPLNPPNNPVHTRYLQHTILYTPNMDTAFPFHDLKYCKVKFP